MLTVRTTDGKTEGLYGELCGLVLKEQETVKGKHTFESAGYVYREATCVSDGEMRYVCRI